MQERLLASMLTHQLVADMKRDSACKHLPLAVCASRNGGPQIHDCARSAVSSLLRQGWRSYVNVRSVILSVSNNVRRRNIGMGKGDRLEVIHFWCWSSAFLSSYVAAAAVFKTVQEFELPEHSLVTSDLRQQGEGYEIVLSFCK